ncbi:MAG TPA: carbon storage regulator [Phycisphaerales bacterium]|nr:carbon storage regulator [Phycisphaerales bacterium]
MLVITRREGEEVVIGDPENPIGVVRIASIKGDRVRVAFEFPRAVSVHRREVADQILTEAGDESPTVVVVRPGDESRSEQTTAERTHPPAGRHADARSV